MDTKELIESRKETVQKFSAYLQAEETLVKKGNGFIEKKYLDNLIETKTEWQDASNRFYAMLSKMSSPR